MAPGDQVDEVRPRVSMAPIDGVKRISSMSAPDSCVRGRRTSFYFFFWASNASAVPEPMRGQCCRRMNPSSRGCARVRRLTWSAPSKPTWRGHFRIPGLRTAVLSYTQERGGRRSLIIASVFLVEPSDQVSDQKSEYDRYGGHHRVTSLSTSFCLRISALVVLMRPSSFINSSSAS